MSDKRRERIATAVLQGMAASGRTVWDEQGPRLEGYAARAVQWADALIAELDDEPTTLKPAGPYWRPGEPRS